MFTYKTQWTKTHIINERKNIISNHRKPSTYSLCCTKQPIDRINLFLRKCYASCFRHLLFKISKANASTRCTVASGMSSVNVVLPELI